MVKQARVAVHFYSFELPDLWPWYFACVWVMTIAHWDWKSRLTFPILPPPRQKHHLGRERAFSNLTHKMWRRQRRQETCGYSGKQRVMNGSRRGQWKLTWSVCRRSCTDGSFSSNSSSRVLKWVFCRCMQLQTTCACKYTKSLFAVID